MSCTGKTFLETDLPRETNSNWKCIAVMGAMGAGVVIEYCYLAISTKHVKMSSSYLYKTRQNVEQFDNESFEISDKLHHLAQQISRIVNKIEIGQRLDGVEKAVKVVSSSSIYTISDVILSHKFSRLAIQLVARQEQIEQNGRVLSVLTIVRS